jgi:hypothetical protein
MLNVADNEHIHCVVTFTKKIIQMYVFGITWCIRRYRKAFWCSKDDRQSMMISKLTTQTVKYIIFNCMPSN